MDVLPLGQCSLAVRLALAPSSCHLCQDKNSNTYSKLQAPRSSFLVGIGSGLLHPILGPWTSQVILVLLICDVGTLSVFYLF